MTTRQFDRSIRQKVMDNLTRKADPKVDWEVRKKVMQNVLWKVNDEIERRVGRQVGGQVMVQFIQETKGKVDWKVRKKVMRQVAQHVDQKASDRVQWQVEWPVQQQFSERVARQVRQQVSQQVWNLVQQNVPQAVEPNVRKQVHKQVTEQVDRNVAEQVDRQATLREIGKKYGLSAQDYRGSQLWASWHAYVSFFAEHGLLQPSRAVDAWRLDETLAKTSGFTWWSADVLSISDRPVFIKRDAEGRLHSETGHAIEYPDGWGIACWHGVQIPVEWVAGALPAPADALTWQNIEQRRVAIELVGWPRILAGLDARSIDRDEDPLIGELVEVTLPGLAKPARFLRYRCGTGREFASGVPPHIATAVEAQAWLTGLDAKSFRLPTLRT
jgi:hypothetical protein